MSFSLRSSYFSRGGVGGGRRWDSKEELGGKGGRKENVAGHDKGDERVD